MRGIYIYGYQTSSGASSFTFTNNLFLNCSNIWYQPNISGYSPFVVTFYNNLLREGSFQFTYDKTGTTWTIKDNLIDCDELSQAGGLALSADYNGYRSGLTTIGGTHNKTGLTPDYQSGPMTNYVGYLGNYYYPTSGGSTSLTNLINTGSRTAPNAGLYHYTTTTNQTKEAASQVDIGFHYVALNGSNQPADTDGDGLPDYLEDRNGNGTFDTGETDWQTSNSGVAGAAALQVFTLLK